LPISDEQAPATEPAQQEYEYTVPGLGFSHTYLLPETVRLLEKHAAMGSRIFEIGSGNGSVAAELSRRGYAVDGIEPSASGVEIAREAFPDINIAQGSGYDDLAGTYGTYPVVLSIEVIEHVYAPRAFAQRCWDLLEPGGHLIMSTPYHGYWKNLVMALSGRMDDHFTVLWDHGHIKFWSIATLSELLRETGFLNPEFSRVGRIPALAKSMFVVAQK